MSAKHTPGPWFANAIAKGRIIGDETAAGAEKIQINNHNATVATVYRSKDARLIAAAPELLAVCERMAKALDRGRYPELQGVADQIAAAIARATTTG